MTFENTACIIFINCCRSFSLKSKVLTNFKIIITKMINDNGIYGLLENKATRLLVDTAKPHTSLENI